MKDLLQEIVKASQGFVELRYHKRSSQSFQIQKGRVEVANHALRSGVGVRALVDGVYGFSATDDLSKAGIEKALAKAQENAKFLVKLKGKGTIKISRARLSQLDFKGPGYDEMTQMAVSDKLSQVIAQERALAQGAQKILSAKCGYNELIEEKVIVTSDGANCSLKMVQPEVSFMAIASDQGQQVYAHQSAGVNGGWQCLYQHPSLEGAVESTVKRAVDLLKAKYPEGGMKTVILSPAMVGLLAHEAIGHTVEADFVKAGSIAQGKIGQKVASPLVHMCDSGDPKTGGYAVGCLPFDDEGVETETTTLIKEGTLVSYLHNRETAEEFGVAPTGNARAWLYDDEPLIRMRNTYVLPGKSKLTQMISEVDEGYLVEGAGGGQADSNGEFMFTSSHVYRIKNGQKGELLRETTLSGIAFDVLKTVDAVSEEFRWDLGSGYCGKGQAAKVDAGGPYLRCQLHVGGRS